MLIITCFCNAQQWTSLSGPFGGNVMDMERDGSGNTYAIVGTSALYKSTDNGTNWTKLATTPSTLALNDILYANNKFYGIYVSNFYVSGDGLTWTRDTSVPFANVSKLLKFGPDGYIAVYGSDGLFVTKDDGVNWTKASSTGESFYRYGYERTVATTNGDLYAISRRTGLGNYVGFEIKKLPYPGASGTFDPANWQIKYTTLKSGTISASTSSNIITGVGTKFTTEITNGMQLYSVTGQYIGYVISITSDLALTVSGNASTSVNGVQFTEYVNNAHLMTNGTNVYLVNNQNIYVTENGGSTWPSIKGNITDNCMWGFGAVNSSGTVYFYNGCYNKIYSLTNPGTTNSTWTITDGYPSIGIYGAYIVSWAFISSTTILAGSNLAGAFKSTDSGSTFNLSTTGMTRGIGRSIIITTSGNKMIYLAGSGTGGVRGYWLSNDFGATWSFVSTTNLYSKALKLSDGTIILYGNNYIARSTDNLSTPFVETYQPNVDLAEASDGTLFATQNVGVYTSTDKGAVWGLVPSSGWVGSSALNIAVDNTNLYISNSSFRVLRLPRAGGTITDITPASGFNQYPLSGFFASGSTLYLATQSSITKTADQGANWTQIGFSGPAVFPISDGTTAAICVGRAGNFYITQDGGNSWNSYATPSTSAYITGIAKDPASSTSSPVYYASAGNSPALKFTGKLIVDPATLPPYINFNWQPLNGPFGGGNGPAYDIEAHPDGSLYSVQNSELYKYVSNIWTKLPMPTPSTLVYDVEIDASGKIYALINSPTPSPILVSTDGGVNWVGKSGQFVKNTTFFYPGYRIEKMPDNSIVVLGPSGLIFRSTDDANSFSIVADYGTGSFTPSMPIIQKSGLLVAYKGTANFTHSSDNGATWTLNTSNGFPFPNGSIGIYNFAVAPNGDFLATVPDVYDAISNSYYSEIYRSTDRGINWAKVASPSVGNFTKYINVMPNGDYILYLTGGVKRYKSNDEGVTWTELSSSGDFFPYYEQFGSNIYLKGYPNGIFKSTDNGTALTEVNNSVLPRPISTDIKLLDNKDMIVASYGAFHSADFGQSWKKGEGIVSQVIFFLVKGDSIIASGPLSSQVYLSTDNGKTWITKSNNRYFSSITTYDGKSYYAICSSLAGTRGLFFSIDLVNWTQVNVSGLPSDPLTYSYSSIAIDANGVIFAVISESSGTSLYKIAFEVATRLADIISPINPRNTLFYKGKIYVYDGIGAIYETDDSGISWQTISAPSGNALRISNDYLFILGSSGVLWLSRNNGASWQSVGETTTSVSFGDVIVNEYDGFAYAAINGSVAKKSQVIVMTDDKTNPLAAAFSPLNNATGIPLKPTISITFNEPITPVAGTKIRLFDPSLGSSIEQIDVSTGIQDGKKWTFNITSTLAFNKVYYLTVDALSFKDIFGNKYGGLSSTTAWRFTTKSPPTVAALSPTLSASGIALNTQLAITFSEPVTGVGGKNLNIYKSSSATTSVATISASTGVSNANELKFTLTGSLDFSTAYFVKFDASSFKTSEGGIFSSLTQNTDWTFTTRAAPTVSSLLPANNSTSIPVNTTLKFSTSESSSIDGTKKLYVTNTVNSSTPIAEVLLSAATISGTSTTVTLPSPLAYATTYAITLDPSVFKSADGGVYSLLTSTGWQFTTRSAPTVSTITPLNNATGVAINTALSLTFSESVSLVGSNKLYITNTAQPATPVVTLNLSSASLSGATATFMLPVPLAYSTTYSITFDPNSFKGVSDNGLFSALTTSGWQFTTVASPDVTAPTITFTSDAFTKGAGSKIFSPSISDNIAVTQAKIFYRSITSNSAESSANLILNASTGKYDATIQETEFGKMGLEFYFTASDAAGNTGRSPQTGYYYSYINFPASASPQIPGGLIGVGGAISDWRIISIPHALTDAKVATVFSELGAVDFKKWRLITYKNATTWDQYPDNFTTFIQGKGYFINTKSLPSSGLIVEGASTPSFNKSTPFVLTLAPGWNHIGNPYSFKIVWSEVLAANGNPSGVSTSVKKYTGSYVDGGDLDVFEGAFVLNNTSSPVLLNVPVTGSLSGGRVNSQSSDLSESNWTVPIVVKVGRFENSFGGIGMNENAAYGIDDFDEFNPPYLFDFAELKFAHPEHFLKNSTRDIVPSQPEYKWGFSFETNIDDAAELSWDNAIFGNNEKELILFDVEKGVMINMRNTSSYLIGKRRSAKPFEIYFGENMSSKIQSKVILGAAYPNPGSKEIFVPFTLPENKSSYLVSLEIFDVLGRKISTLVEKSLGSGNYTTTWEPKSENESGLYTVRLIVSNENRADTFYQKIILK